MRTSIKHSIALFLLFSVVTGNSWAATLADLTVPGASLSLNNVVLTNFVLTSTGSLPSGLNPSLVSVFGLADDIQFVFPDIGNSQNLDITLSYDVNSSHSGFGVSGFVQGISSPFLLLKAISTSVLDLSNKALGTTNVAAYNQDILVPAQLWLQSLGLSPSAYGAPSDQISKALATGFVPATPLGGPLSDTVLFSQTVTSLHITQQIQLAGGGPASFSGTSDQGFVVAAVPIPAAIWLLGSALAGMAVIGRRRN